MKNTNETSFSLSDLKIPVPGNNVVVKFIKENRLYLFLGVIALSLVALAVIPTQPSVLRSQLNISETNRLTVPTDDTSSIPVVVSDANESAENISGDSLLTILNENTNNQNVAAVADANSDDPSVLYPSAGTEEGLNSGVGYEDVSGGSDQNTNDAASLSQTNAKSGPETFVILFFSLAVAGTLYVLKGKKVLNYD